MRRVELNNLYEINIKNMIKKQRPTISVSMIVKNETSCLAQCLESVIDFDEIIICDTGSTDDTIEIAKRYTDKVYEDYQWNDDFAEARNHSLSKCGGDWIYIIDADEYIEEGTYEKLQKIIEEEQDTQSIFVNTIATSSKQTHNSIRCFKNNIGILWVSPIHNYLNVNTGFVSDINHYYGYSEAHKLDPDRAFRILKKKVFDIPNPTPREYYYLAREYYYRNDYGNAIKYFLINTTKSTFVAEIADAYLYIGRCYNALNDLTNAHRFTMKAISINTNFKEAILFMGSISGPNNKKRWDEFAINANNSSLLFTREQTPIIIEDKFEKEAYDQIFDTSERYKQHYKDLIYYPIWKHIQKSISKNKKYVDIGCGPGHLGHLLHDQGFKDVVGIDFSEVALTMAKSNVPSFSWVKADLRTLDFNEYNDCDFLSIETFEHIDDDVALIKRLPKKNIIFSVPNYWAPNHYRVYEDEKFIVDYYKDVLKIKSIRRFNMNSGLVETGNLTKGNNYIFVINAKII